MIFVDSNIPMYLVGQPHPNKSGARRLVEAAVEAGERLVTDAEVLQEILHRYVALDRRDAIQPAFDAILGVVDEVIPIVAADVERAKAIVLGRKRLSARDALHVAVMEREGVARIMTFDAGFDGVPGLTRLSAE
ncbi:MAG TPA: type II toxin-antitoxin system VapC family toxin [Polyangia bacterium]|nr:type II toxin-antitoxin system VapC family toxin [Polyangia bacterium]